MRSAGKNLLRGLHRLRGRLRPGPPQIAARLRGFRAHGGSSSLALHTTYMPVPSTRTLFYRPSAAEADQTPDSRFRRFVNEKHGLALRDYWELHRWSITELNDFWVAVWELRLLPRLDLARWTPR